MMELFGNGGKLVGSRSKQFSVEITQNKIRLICENLWHKLTQYLLNV
jgi:hypothetical protein